MRNGFAPARVRGRAPPGALRGLAQALEPDDIKQPASSRKRQKDFNFTEEAHSLFELSNSGCKTI